MPTSPHALHLPPIPGLANAVAAAPHSEKHLPLLRAVHQFQTLESAKLVAVHVEGRRRHKRKVLDAGGALLHEDHRDWLRLQLEVDAGHAGTTQARLLGQGFLLSVCELKTMYLVQGRNGAGPADFLQLEINIEDEFIDRELFARRSWGEPPRDLRGLVTAAEDGERVSDEARRRLRPSTYALERVVDMARFVEESEALEIRMRNAGRKRLYELSDSFTGELQRVVTMEDLSPGWGRFAGKSKRIFEDWSASSAGRSGAKIYDHWVMKTSDWTDEKGSRSMSLIPAWTFDKKMAAIDAGKGNVYELFGKLEKLDLRMKAPFAWYFFMLHGNRVKDDAGRRILQAAEDGLIVLPERDYRVLKAWSTHSYGF